jgi:hypothetical protein
VRYGGTPRWLELLDAWDGPETVLCWRITKRLLKTRSVSDVFLKFYWTKMIVFSQLLTLKFSEQRRAEWDS